MLWIFYPEILERKQFSSISLDTSSKVIELWLRVRVPKIFCPTGVDRHKSGWSGNFNYSRVRFVELDNFVSDWKRKTNFSSLIGPDFRLSLEMRWHIVFTLHTKYHWPFKRKVRKEIDLIKNLNLMFAARRSTARSSHQQFYFKCYMLSI